MRIFFARVLFATLAATALAASTGVAAPPHRVPAGTPLVHSLVLGAYRFGFLIEPAKTETALTPQMAALHRTFALAGIPMIDMPGMAGSAAKDDGPVFAAAGLSPIQDTAVEFALLVIFIPRLARPTRRTIAELPLPRIAAQQWSRLLSPEPPRLLVLARPA